MTVMVFGEENLEVISFLKLLKKPVEDLEILFARLRNSKKFISDRDKYFKNWVGSPTRFIKLKI